VNKKLRYLSAHQHLMQYPTYQQAGWHIGFGMGESANKLVMQTRLKGLGCVGLPLISTPCWLCEPPSVMSAGQSLGRRYSSSISTTAHCVATRGPPHASRSWSALHSCSSYAFVRLLPDEPALRLDRQPLVCLLLCDAAWLILSFPCSSLDTQDCVSSYTLCKILTGTQYSEIG